MAPFTQSTTATDIPEIALGIAAHPDDLDFGAAGTFACWAASGAQCYYLILTNGNKGSADRSADPAALMQLRRHEQREAAKILGIRDVFFCDYEDGALQVSMEVKKDIVRVIRQVRPQTVVTMDPTMIYNEEMGFINHPDHRAAGQAALDAIYPLARDHLSFPELLHDEDLEPHNVATVLLTNFGRQNHFVDISDCFETKMRALSAHASQIADGDTTGQLMRRVAEGCGVQAGVALAEGFVRIDVR